MHVETGYFTKWLDIHNVHLRWFIIYPERNTRIIRYFVILSHGQVTRTTLELAPIATLIIVSTHSTTSDLSTLMCTNLLYAADNLRETETTVAI